MARLSKADAARQLGISRTTLYKLIDQGKVSATPDGLIDQTELVRAAPYVDTLKERSRTSMDSTEMDTHISHDEHRERPPEPVHEQPWTPVHARPWTSTDPLVDVLREQLQRAQERERVYEERERAYHDQIARLTAMLHESHQQNQRLLDMPRSASGPAPPHLEAPGAPAALAFPRGEMRRRIVALLREHPEGLSPVQTRHLLGLAKDLGSTMKAMARDGLLRREKTGWYIAHEA
jgi:transposase-like protein